MTNAFDESGLLRDGERFHLPLHMKDAMQRDIVAKIPSQEEIENPCLAQKLPNQTGPWPTNGTTETRQVKQAREKALQAHEAYTNELKSAWKKPTSMWRNRGPR